MRSIGMPPVRINRITSAAARIKKDDIEDRRVVPLYSPRESSNIAVLWNDAKRTEKELYNIPGGCHRNVKGEQDVAHHLPAIVLAINVENRQDDQVCKNETDNTTKTDPPSP